MADKLLKSIKFPGLEDIYKIPHSDIMETYSIEPSENDIPKVFFGDELQQSKTEKIVPFRYISKTQDISGYSKIKAQGNSSMMYPKKNQNIKLYADSECNEKMKVDFKNWGKQSKYCCKANWIDLTHARNVVSARIWADVVKSRPDYAELPEELRTSPNQGAVDGFPVKVYAEGVYQGRYTVNIPKDKWMANIDDSLDTHCILCGEDYVSGCFRAAAEIDGTDWTDEIHDTVPESIKTRWNEVISFVMNSTDEEFKQNLENYFDVASLIDYDLFGILSCGLDAYGKNQLYITYDGQKWFASMYDMDSTWGLWWNGQSFVSFDYSRTDFQDFKDGEGNLLYIRLRKLFREEMQVRWEELRAGALSLENIINRFERFTDIATSELVKEDYASTTGDGNFTGIPSQDTNNIQQIRAFARLRHMWTDEYIANLPQIIPCTGITLNTNALTFTNSFSQTLIVTVTPDGCTDNVTWESDDSNVATVSDGVVLPVSNGTANITARCGNKTAACSVTVEIGAVSLPVMYSLPEETTFDGISDYIDTGINLFDTLKDFSIELEFTDTSDTTQTPYAAVFHNVREQYPNAGLSLFTRSDTYYVAGYNGSGTSVGYNMKNVVNRIKIAYNTVNKTVSWNIGDNNIVTHNIAYNSEAGGYMVTYDGKLILGANSKVDGTIFRFWKGIIHKFVVYDGVLPNALLTFTS